jgi:hypothetical protein
MVWPGPLVRKTMERDEEVDRWHDSAVPREGGIPLHTCLGFTWPEYRIWAKEPDALVRIIAARVWS